MINGDKIWLVNRYIHFDMDNKTVSCYLEAYSTKKKALERVEKLKEKMQPIPEWVNVTEITLDEELD